MASRGNNLASAKARDLLAGLDAHVPGECYEMTLDGIEPDAEEEETSTLNDAEANNLSFIVSDKFSRMDRCLTMLESETSDTNYEQLAERVAVRLDELSKRLADEPDDAAEDVS